MIQQSISPNTFIGKKRVKSLARKEEAIMYGRRLIFSLDKKTRRKEGRKEGRAGEQRQESTQLSRSIKHAALGRRRQKEPTFLAVLHCEKGARQVDRTPRTCIYRERALSASRIHFQLTLQLSLHF